MQRGLAPTITYITYINYTYLALYLSVPIILLFYLVTLFFSYPSCRNSIQTLYALCLSLNLLHFMPSSFLLALSSTFLLTCTLYLCLFPVRFPVFILEFLFLFSPKSFFLYIISSGSTGLTSSSSYSGIVRVDCTSIYVVSIYPQSILQF